MTDRFKGLTVTFERDIRADNIEAISDAIRMIKGVQDVSPVRATGDDHMVRERVRQEFEEEIYDLLERVRKR